MRVFAFLSVALATAPILALTASPKANETILAVFDDTDVMSDILNRTRQSGLTIIGYDEAFHHVVVKDRDGQSARILYGLGARLVVDANVFSCQPVSYGVV